MKKNINIAIVVLLLIALSSATYIGYYCFSSATQQEHDEELRQIFWKDDSRTGDVMSLKKQNNDIMGWLYIPGTKIDYPIMYTPKEPEYYLRRDFEKKYSLAGTLFVDGRCNVEMPSDNLIIYGHNMQDKSMFADLIKYKTEEFYRENTTIYLYTSDKAEKYSIIAVLETDVADLDRYDFYGFIHSDENNTLDNYISNAYISAIYKTDKDITPETKLITLSTCLENQNNGRLIVIASLEV